MKMTFDPTVCKNNRRSICAMISLFFLFMSAFVPLRALAQVDYSCSLKSYYQPTNYYLPLCPGSDNSCSCDIAEPCVTNVTSLTVTFEDDASSSGTSFLIDDRFESGDEFFNDFRTYYELQDDSTTLKKIAFEPCALDSDATFRTAINECLAVSETISISGNCYLTKWGPMSDWDTSKITNMTEIFMGKKFNGNISEWNTSQVTTMAKMFSETDNFNKDISGWNVSKVSTMADMFRNALAFDQPIYDWTVTSVTNMNGMFEGASQFLQDITSWNPKSDGTFEDMFASSKFSEYYACKNDACSLAACANTCVVRLPIGGRLRAYVSALKKFVQKTRSLHSQPADLATVLTQTVF